ncbi:MAG: tetratricopeptide repeat protein [Gammaproteobacteria bacterium]|nr:tetratricopeptide repeat protein [Gammaproteobacteria bacterium]
MAIVVLVLLLAGCAATGPGGGTDRPAAEAVQPKVDPKITTAYELALSAMQDGNTAQAESALRQLAEAYPDFSGPHANLGILYFRDNKLEQAKSEFHAALKINPQNVVSLNHLGIISRGEGKFKEAHDYYEKALQIDPEYAYAHLNFGILLELYMGKLTEALGHYERYQELIKAEGKEEDAEVGKWIVDLGRRAKK